MLGSVRLSKIDNLWHNRVRFPDAIANINLTPELEFLVQKKVKSGRYNSASEVVREALRLFEDRERVREARLQSVRRKIEEGWADAERGDLIDGEDFFRRLQREGNLTVRKRKRA